jgi:hypothetical protein
MKDFFNPIGNTKLVKKVSAICLSGNYNVSERVSLKIK